MPEGAAGPGTGALGCPGLGHGGAPDRAGDVVVWWGKVGGMWWKPGPADGDMWMPCPGEGTCGG